MAPMRFACTLIACLAGAAHASEGFIQIDLARDGAKLPVYQMTRSDADATVVLLPGGNAGTAVAGDGAPTSGNFLVRSRGHFHAHKLNVLIVFRASDQAALDYASRAGAEHVREIEHVIDHAARTLQRPVWLVGTSRGTVSATAAAISLGPTKVAGPVLTASVTGNRPGAVPSQPIEKLAMPVLVVHHAKDSCRVCNPTQAMKIPARLSAAPVKKGVLIEAGADPQGDPCEPFHWHGFIGAEEATVRLIADWIRKPTS